MRVALPPFGVEMEVTDEQVKTHGPDECGGEFCCIHNPSDHRMRDWPMTLRLDWGVPLVERRCEHGVGHPDPDSVAWLESQGHDSFGVHGCDGCCRG